MIHNDATITKLFFRFLGQLLVFEWRNTSYWTVCSKNAAGESEFTLEAKRLFEPFITRDLVDVMVRERLHICAEVISKSDEIHGAKVLCETPVVTVIGRSTGSKEPEFVSFLKHEEVVNFCSTHNLSCDSAVIIDGQENCNKFLVKLSKKRDFMDNSQLNNLLQSLDEVHIQSGTVTHQEVLGNVLEGLVLHLTKSDGTIETKK